MTQELLADLRSRINPAYQDMRGTESYERKQCADAIEALMERLEKAEKDAARLDWLQTKLFTQRWNGVVGAGCLTQWSIAPDYRHSLTTMQTGDIEIDFRGAIDRAMEASK